MALGLGEVAVGGGWAVSTSIRHLRSEAHALCWMLLLQALDCTSCGRLACTATTTLTSWWTWWHGERELHCEDSHVLGVETMVVFCVRVPSCARQESC